ncbi:VOC family protein [Acanthopleuribacter pedis]|uniref:VOC family protein n=1 Tax=Acanthopleuribacter pedis TaxID=442870 RepID=A0A8J7Q8J4_9BACT|nr:VOC family protein [Acanthopleuribacter pedis]MBO1319404.1 VOC family protein [Acanthopleuribacter pedis]
MSDNKTRHGMPSWIEHQSPQPAEALAFYQTVLGWEIATITMPDGGTYSCIQVDGQAIGGFAEGDGRWLPYLTVDDVDGRARQALEAGATLEKAPFTAPGVGRICTLRDPHGARIALITYADS